MNEQENPSPHLFQRGDFTLNSGSKSTWKIECDALTPADWEGAAELVCLLVGPFRAVVGVPRGGAPLAAALRYRYTAFLPGGDTPAPVLIVDDVLTTGGSMTRLRDRLVADYQYKPGEIVGAVLFARGPLPEWVKAVCPLPECFWLKPTTPTTAAEVAGAP